MWGPYGPHKCNKHITAYKYGCGEGNMLKLHQYGDDVYRRKAIKGEQHNGYTNKVMTN